jgi:uncharacterized protein (TIGR03435 family)
MLHILLCMLSIGAQAPGLTFEVASIKPFVEGKEEAHGMGIRASGNQVHVKRLTLAGLVGYAYSRQAYEISGGPAWAEKEQFNIDAKAPGNDEPSQDDIREMMGALLTERFHLKFHEATKSMPVYALVVSKKGLKMKPGQPDAPPRYQMSGRVSAIIEGTNSPLAVLARNLQYNGAGRPVVDQTGLKGGFDYKLEFSPPTATDAEGPSLFTAIQEQLGLKLVPAKAPVRVLVIDEATRPSLN